MAVRVESLAEGHVTTWAGKVRVEASPRGVRSVWLPRWQEPAEPASGYDPRIVLDRSHDGMALRHLHQALNELAEFFAGERRDFAVALDMQGPQFFRTVWLEVARVPSGETRSYLEIARTVGSPLAMRAVGAANAANPLAPFVPCHRIVGNDGRLTGYGPGLPMKQRLLVMEDAIPASPADYHAWTQRVSARLGTPHWYLGVRGAGVYCSPGCNEHAQRRYLPGRLFLSAEDATAAGFQPCRVCQREVPVTLW